MECLAEDDLLDLATGRRLLADTPALEAHLADCATCSGVLSTLVADPPRVDRTGTTLAHYRLDGLIGVGGGGEVYRAWDTRLARKVALKVTSGGAHEAEARAAAAIAHPNVVTVFDAGAVDGVGYVASELIAGESLRSRIDRGIARADAIALAIQLARGIAAAHAHGIVHRDLKPANMLVVDDTLKILDFGLATNAPAGGIVGTAGYLAPEQARGEPADARSDIFAAGCVIYELLSSRRAFGGTTFAEKLSATLCDQPFELPDPVWPIVQRCLAKDPAKRFQSATDLAWALSRKPPRAITRRMFVAGAAASGLVGGVLGRWLAPSARSSPPLEFRQLTFRQGRVARARFTADGDTVVYTAAWDDAPLTTFASRVAGGGTRELGFPRAQLLAVSTRGELALALDHHFVDGFPQQGRLALAPLEGGAPRDLGVDVQDADFTPDGELVVVRRTGTGYTLESPIGTVRHAAAWLANPRVGPDGAIAVCTYASPSDDAGELVVIERGRTRTVGGLWSSLDGVAWAPDGLWVSAARTGGNNAVRLLDRNGRERRVIANVGRLRMYDAGRGALAVTQTGGRLHMVGGTAAGERELGLADVSLVGAISDDGSTVAFLELGDVDATGAYVRSIGGGPATRLGAGTPMDIGPHGVLAIDGTALVTYPERAGRPMPIAHSLAGIGRARWSGDSVVVGGTFADRAPRLWRISAGAATPLTPEGTYGRFAVSPAGRVALVAGGILLVDGRAVPGSYTDDVVCAFTARGLFVRSVTIPIRIRRVDLDTGAQTLVREISPPPLGLRAVYNVVTNGEHYAYSYSQELSRLYALAI